MTGYDGAERSLEKERGYVAPLKGVAWIAIGVFIFAALLKVGLRVVLSMSDLRMIQGQLGINSVKNYQYIFSSPPFGNALIISIAVHVVRVGLCLGFGMIGAAIGRSGRMARAIAGSAGLMLAFIPSVVWDALIGVTVPDVGRNTALDVALRTVLTALPWVGLSVFLGAMLTPVWRGKTARAGLASGLLAMLTLMTGSLEQRAISYGSSSLTARVRGIEEFIFLQAFQNGRLSVGTAAEVVRGFIGLLPLIAAAVLLAILLRGAEPKSAKIPVQTRRVVPSLIGGLAAGLLPLAVYALLFLSGSVSRDLVVSAASTDGMNIAVLVFEVLLGSGIYFGLLLCIGKLTHKSTFPLILLLVFGSALAGSGVAGYYLASKMGLLNTWVPLVMNALFAPLPLTLLLSAALLRPRRVVTCLLMAIGIACLSAVYAMGNVTSCLMYNSNRSMVTVGGWLYWLVSAADPRGGRLDFAANVVSAAGIVLVYVAIPIGIGAGLLTSGTTRE